MQVIWHIILFTWLCIAVIVTLRGYLKRVALNSSGSKSTDQRLRAFFWKASQISIREMVYGLRVHGLSAQSIVISELCKKENNLLKPIFVESGYDTLRLHVVTMLEHAEVSVKQWRRADPTLTTEEILTMYYNEATMLAKEHEELRHED